MKVRTRFAPSPTGFLHIGGARTALYSWLYAKKNNGQFILRIEDTDRERSTQESIDAIIHAIDWLGLQPDEGPFYQMTRLERYHEIAEQLIKEDKAYQCYCSKERLEQLREKQVANKQKPRYDGYCRQHKPQNIHQPYVVRFKNPLEGEVSFTDVVYGNITVKNSELDDVVLLRSDGIPTYNFSVVVDDIDMRITHVIRGDDHINNTPRQINIIQALKGNIPIYAHAPMILGSDGKRLSKRHGAVNVMQYKEEGYLPEAMLNYLVRLGWSHGDQEIFSKTQMIDLFDIAHINRAAAKFDPEKLLWLNHHYIKTGNPMIIAQSLKYQLEKLGVDITQGPELTEIIKTQRERCKDLKEMAEKSRFFFEDIKQYDEKAARKNLTADAKIILQKIYDVYTQLENWNKERIHQVVLDTAETMNIKLGKVAQPIRTAVSGTEISPPIDETLWLLGKEKTLSLLK